MANRSVGVSSMSLSLIHIFIPAGAEAFKKDIPAATAKFLPTGHFALETHLEEMVATMRPFLWEINQGRFQ